MGEGLAKILKAHKRLSADTSVLIYHFEDVPPYSALTEALFVALGRGEAELILSTLCLTEFLVKPWEKGERRAKEALALLLGIPNARFLAPDVEVAAEAARLRARYGLRTPDALLLATAMAGGATAFLTNDRGFLRVREGPEVFLLDDLLSQSH